MKTLFVLRHAKSDRHDAGIQDHDRPLNQRGKRAAARMGRLLREENLLPDLIMTSSAHRARQTVDELTPAAGYQGPTVTVPQFYLAGPEIYLTTLASLDDDHRRVMVVGHNPGMEELVARLTGTSTTMPTATLVEITLPVTVWHELGEEVRGDLQGVWRPGELSPHHQ